jgi:hypothetical protein
VYGVENRAQYMKKLPSEKLLKLKPQAAYCTPVDYGTL